MNSKEIKFTDTTKPNFIKKNTAFTHQLDIYKGWIEVDNFTLTENITEIKYLGKCATDGDIFAVITKKNMIHIYKGQIGDEFD